MTKIFIVMHYVRNAIVLDMAFYSLQEANKYCNEQYSQNKLGYFVKVVEIETLKKGCNS